MIGTIKINTDFTYGVMNPKLFSSIFSNLPVDSVIQEMFIDEFKRLNILIKSDFFTKDGEIITSFKRNISVIANGQLPISHDHFCGLDFSEVITGE